MALYSMIAGPVEGYVHVEDDGSARELSDDEKAYLSELFHPNDGGRPYIKNRYEDRAPDGRIGGFLLRRSLPAAMTVKAAP